MAITMKCPRCTHKNSFDDAQAGTPVNCRICHHGFTLSGAAPSAASPAQSPPAKPNAPSPTPAASVGLQAGLPSTIPVLTPIGPTQTREGPPPASSRSRKPAPIGEEERDQRRREARPRSSVGWILGIILGGVGVVAVVGGCLVAPLVFWVGWRSAPAPAIDDAVVVVQAPPIQQGPFNPPIFQPNIPVLPAPPRFDPNNANQLDAVLAALKNGGGDEKDALLWLKEANPNHAGRTRAARALESLAPAKIDAQNRNVFSESDFFTAYFRWATVDNVPSLVQMVEDDTFRIDTNERRHKAIATLGTLKDGRGAEALCKRLGDVFNSNQAISALEVMGPPAEPALLRRVNHGNGGVRGDARRILKRIGTSDDTILTQTLADLGSPDNQVRDAAIDSLAQTPVIANRKKEVAGALEPLIVAKTSQDRVVKALEVWATPELAVIILMNLDSNAFIARDQIKLVGKMREPRTIPHLVGLISRPFAGDEARNVLKQFGKQAEPEVVKALISNDEGLRREAAKLLGDIGTIKGSGPALQAATMAYPNDGLLRIFAQQSMKAILARGM
jgi:HEAT repeat protein